MKLVIGAFMTIGVMQGAVAADTITFTGAVDSNTCTVDVGSSASPKITLPTVGAGSLTAAGKTAGATPFSINIKGCSQTADDVAVRFTAHNPDGANLGVSSATGSATNISIQLLNGSAGSSPLVFNNGIATTAKQTTSSGTTTYNMTAQYYAKDQVTAGSVTAVADYEVIYP